MYTQRKPLSLPAQFADLFLIQLANWRWSWRGMLVTGMIFPLFSIIALSTFARDAGPRVLSYILTGNVVMSLMFENNNKVCGHFSYMHEMGTLSYFAALPIQRYILILATVLSFLVLSLPALASTIFLGSLLLGIHIAPQPLILLVIPFTAMPLAGIGALIGASMPPAEASSFSLIFSLVMVSLGPVIVPPERLPAAMRLLGRLSPATYAASAWRQVLLGPVTGQIVLDLAALAAFSLIVLWLVNHKLDWRQA